MFFFLWAVPEGAAFLMGGIVYEGTRAACGNRVRKGKRRSMEKKGAGGRGWISQMAEFAFLIPDLLRKMAHMVKQNLSLNIEDGIFYECD